MLGVDVRFLIYALPHVQDVELAKPILVKVWEAAKYTLPNQTRDTESQFLKKTDESIQTVNEQSLHDVVKSIVEISESLSIELVDKSYLKTAAGAFKELIQRLDKQKGFNREKFLADYVKEGTVKQEANPWDFLKKKKDLKDNEKHSKAANLDVYLEDVAHYYGAQNLGDYTKFLYKALKSIPEEILSKKFDCQSYKNLNALKENIEPLADHLAEFQSSAKEKAKALINDHKHYLEGLQQSKQEEIKRYGEERDARLILAQQIMQLSAFAASLFLAVYKDNLNSLYGLSAITFLGSACGLSAFPMCEVWCSVVFVASKVAQDFNVPHRPWFILGVPSAMALLYNAYYRMEHEIYGSMCGELEARVHKIPEEDEAIPKSIKQCTVNFKIPIGELGNDKEEHRKALRDVIRSSRKETFVGALTKAAKAHFEETHDFS